MLILTGTVNRIYVQVLAAISAAIQADVPCPNSLTIVKMANDIAIQASPTMLNAIKNSVEKAIKEDELPCSKIVLK